MPPKLYELKVFKGRNKVATANRLLESLDLTNPEVVKDLLRRHLLAVAERDGATRREAHLYHLDIHELRDNRAERDALFTFALPLEL